MASAEYVALQTISGKSGRYGWTVRKGKPVAGKALISIGGGEAALKSGLVCLKSDYDKIELARKDKNDKAIKKGEEARALNITKRKEDLATARKEKLGIVEEPVKTKTEKSE